MNPNLLQGGTLSSELRLNFGVDQSAGRRQLDRPQQIAAKNLERAVDITQVGTEKHAHRDVEYFREEAAVQRIVPLQPKPGHDIEMIDKRREERDVADIELAVGIHEHHVIADRCPKS